ncbi:SAM-dependent methyltransferase [Paraburkholderia atlantica]|uniref:class I SAM-dependent methyltransferase n=1 Tax=Paraburkholderia atlantica TaxID=2654982 RepID=UPI003D21B6C7
MANGSPAGSGARLKKIASLRTSLTLINDIRHVAADGALMSNAKEHARYYAARAPGYDASVGYGTVLVEAGLAPLKQHLVNALSGLDVLEIACGTGYWTHAISGAARSLYAVDYDAASLELARRRLAHEDHVRFQRADAYRLDEVPARFEGAFGMFWWSHMPRARIGSFLDVLHARMLPGSPIVFADQMPYRHTGSRRFDEHGDLIEERLLEDGTRFEVVKNFPDEQEVGQLLSGRAREISYVADPDRRWWLVRYRTA